MSGEDIRIGPFIGGLNTFSDASAVADSEVVELINFECDIDGSLVSRPPIVDTGALMTLGATGNLRILGYYITTAGAPYLIGSDGLNSTYYFNGTTWVLITATVAAAAMCQFRGDAWLVASPVSGSTGGKWNPVSGFTADAAMPSGTSIVTNKERLWIGKGAAATTNVTRLYLTDIVSAAPVWAGNFIDIGAGDGEAIVALAVYYSDIVVFKEGSTYRFAYDADPSVGDVINVSDTIGASNELSIASYENQLFVLSGNKVYSFTNYNYDKLNTKVPLKANNPSATLSEYGSISVWGDRLFVAYYDKMYVYSLNTRTWSEWVSSALSNIGRVIAPPANQPTATAKAYTYSTTPRARGLYSIKINFDSGSEAMVCSVQTKNYDYQTSQRFKRLFWWGVDALVRTDVAGYVLPVTYASSVTWDQLAAYTWDQIAVNTWDRPLDVSLIVSDSVSTGGVTSGRKFIKFAIKSLRFRQVGFRIVCNTTGTSTDAPIRIYSLLTQIKDKELVSSKIS